MSSGSFGPFWLFWFVPALPGLSWPVLVLFGSVVSRPFWLSTAHRDKSAQIISMVKLIGLRRGKKGKKKKNCKSSETRVAKFEG